MAMNLGRPVGWLLVLGEGNKVPRSYIIEILIVLWLDEVIGTQDCCVQGTLQAFWRLHCRCSGCY